MRSAVVLGAAAAAGAAAWAHFAARPAMSVKVGLRDSEALVPAHYQASAFPAFAALATSLAFDAAAGRPRLLPRALLLAATGTIAAARLAGTVPLSGHAVFLAGALAHELCAPAASRTPFATVLAGAGLAVTSYYKLAVWQDGAWFAASAVVGVIAGACAGAGARAGA